MSEQFPPISFCGELRPSQEDVVRIARRKLAAGKRRLHIVAPPGSGKTVLGLFLWAECIRQPAVVLSPNSAIQAQWAARTDLFEIPPTSLDVVSTDPARPALLTSLTYQSVTLPGRGDADIDALVIDLWQGKLIEAEQAQDPDEAAVWIEDLKRHNPEYYNRRLASYRKQVREAAAFNGQTLEMLHQSSLDTLRRLKQRGVGLILLDECHHLMGHWGRVLADAHDLLEQPMVVGLTATPPDRDGRRSEDVERYDEFFGEVDYEVPVPAVVKDGFLAPYQDLAYFVRPTREELRYIANADEQLHTIVDDLCRPAPVDRAAIDGDTGAASDAVTDSDRDAGSSHHDFDDASGPVVEALPAGEVFARRGKSDGDNDRSVEEPAAAGVSFAATGEPLSDWLLGVLADLRLPTGRVADWSAFERRDPVLADAARYFLLRRGHRLPQNVPYPESDLAPAEIPDMEVLTPVLDRYVRHQLRRSNDPADHELAEQVVRRLRTLGVQITETGSQACASPVGRVMAYSRSKTTALVSILEAERRALGDRIRAVVVADYEKTSATSADIEHLLDREAGGAIAAFRTLVGHPVGDGLDPILVTGSSVFVDDDLADEFDVAAKQWLAAKGFSVELKFGVEEGFHTISGQGGDWCPRVYVAMITDLFQRGLTKCLVGTRGLLGEGWDANKVNVLVDLTTVTTSMTVNQLRGRSIRLDPAEPAKLANNWDVVCIAPEFSKGLDDYKRFIAKHKTLFGITDDGAIEKGVGHVHAAFTELKPEGLEGSLTLLNEDMLQRVDDRHSVRAAWRIGDPYSSEPVRALEIKASGVGGFPPFKASRDPWNARSLTLAIGEAVLYGLIEADLLADSYPVHLGERAGGYVRVFLEEAPEEDSRRFAKALHEAMGPLHRPRYVIPRQVDRVQDTWLSKLLPEVVGRYFQRRRREQVMLHAVPSELAKNKRLVAIYERFWNQFVSPGEAVYAYHGTGKDLVDQARRQGQLPKGSFHEKEIFL